MSKAGQGGEYVLVIDLGTGGPKAGVINQEGHVAACTSAPVRLLFLPDGGAENDPAEWWSSIKSCVKKVLQESGVARKDIIAVGVTSYWGVTVPVDEGGKPLMNAMSWMDKRGIPYDLEIVKGFPNVQGYKLDLLLKYVDKHGFPPSPGDALGHMLYVKHERPDIYKRTYKFFEPMDYINMRLTGRFAATQNTMIPMLVVDNRRLDRTEYDPWLVKMSTIDPDKFPELLPIDGILGTLTPEAAAELGLEPGTTVVCGVQDNSTSAVGAGAIGDAEPAAVMGTSGHMAFHLPFKKSDLTHTWRRSPAGSRAATCSGPTWRTPARPWTPPQDASCAPPTRLDASAIPLEIYQRADRIASAVQPGSGGVLFHPWLNGSMSPGQDECLRGSFPQHPRQHQPQPSHAGGLRGNLHELALAARAGREAVRTQVRLLAADGWRRPLGCLVADHGRRGRDPDAPPGQSAHPQRDWHGTAGLQPAGEDQS